MTAQPADNASGTADYGNTPWSFIHRTLGDVADERMRQITKWGGHEGDGVENPSQSNYVRLRVLAEEFGEVAEAMGRPEDGNGKRHLRTELVQVAAVAVAWIEALDRVQPPRHRPPCSTPSWTRCSSSTACSTRTGSSMPKGLDGASTPSSSTADPC